jgi:hypothetical protein
LDITYHDYAPKLCDQCAFNIACLATIKQTDFEYFAQDDFRVRKPDIKFQVLFLTELVLRRLSGMNEVRMCLCYLHYSDR